MRIMKDKVILADCSNEGKIIFPKRNSYSIIALNLETIEDVEKVKQQCESIILEIQKVEF